MELQPLKYTGFSHGMCAHFALANLLDNEELATAKGSADGATPIQVQRLVEAATKKKATAHLMLKTYPSGNIGYMEFLSAIAALEVGAEPGEMLPLMFGWKTDKGGHFAAGLFDERTKSLILIDAERERPVEMTAHTLFQKYRIIYVGVLSDYDEAGVLTYTADALPHIFQAQPAPVQEMPAAPSVKPGKAPKAEPAPDQPSTDQPIQQ